MKDPRYDGKPLLRIIELYVQHLIGELTARDSERLMLITPKLQSTYGRGGAWHEVISSVLNYGKPLETEIRNEWQRARAAGLSAEAFSRAVADKISSL